MQKEQGLHEMAAIKIPTDGGGGREVAFPSWSETKNRRADSEQVLQSSGCSLFTSKYFKISLRPSGQLFCDMGCLFKGTMALLQSARFVAVGPAALEHFGWRRSHRLTVQNYFFFFFTLKVLRNMCCRKFSSPFCLSCLNSTLQLNVNGSIDILLCLKEACVISKANICTLSLAPLRAIFLLHRNVVQQSEERSDTRCQDGRISILFMAIQFSPSWTYVLLVRQLKNDLAQNLRASGRMD